jgi:polyhydroxyalkanoate synthesis regulator phasin
MDPKIINQLEEIIARVLKRAKVVTKDDVKNFLTKADAKNFVTKEDIREFATKDDINKLEGSLHAKIKHDIEETISQIVTSTDKIKADKTTVNALTARVKNLERKVTLL